jgi:hypothetical protein
MALQIAEANVKQNQRREQVTMRIEITGEMIHP